VHPCWYAQIVAAACVAGCRHLLIKDLQDGQVLAGVPVINPFAPGAEESLRL
jgi:predicted nucleic acid-binding protein